MAVLAGLTLCFASSLLCLYNNRLFPSKSTRPTRQEGVHKKRAPNSLNLKVQVFLKGPHTSDHRTRAPHGCFPVTAAGVACVQLPGGGQCGWISCFLQAFYSPQHNCWACLCQFFLDALCKHVWMKEINLTANFCLCISHKPSYIFYGPSWV